MYLRDWLGDDDGRDGGVGSGKHKHDEGGDLCGKHVEDVKRLQRVQRECWWYRGKRREERV